eukprot:12070381-Ditylum_brightwellii.AAC.1
MDIDKKNFLKQYEPFITMYSDANIAGDIRERSSTTSLALLTNGVVKHWDISKHGESIEDGNAGDDSIPSMVEEGKNILIALREVYCNITAILGKRPDHIWSTKNIGPA